MAVPTEQLAFRSALEVVARTEPRVAEAIRAELASQRTQRKLIASENYASPAVLLAMGNWLSDKYAEGVPGRRMYAGCEHVDKIERVAAEHATALFGADHAYVQPHSGIDANLVAFWAVLARRVERPFLGAAGAGHVNDLSPDHWAELRRRLGDQRMLGMSLNAGGHLTHGFRPNISGKMFDQSSYGVGNGVEVVTSTTHKSLRGPRGGMVLSTADYAEYVDRGRPAPSSRSGTSPARDRHGAATHARRAPS